MTTKPGLTSTAHGLGTTATSNFILGENLRFSCSSITHQMLLIQPSWLTVCPPSSAPWAPRAGHQAWLSWLHTPASSSSPPPSTYDHTHFPPPVLEDHPLLIALSGDPGWARGETRGLSQPQYTLCSPISDTHEIKGVKHSNTVLHKAIHTLGSD